MHEGMTLWLSRVAMTLSKATFTRPLPSVMSCSAGSLPGLPFITSEPANALDKELRREEVRTDIVLVLNPALFYRHWNRHTGGQHKIDTRSPLGQCLQFT
jgi:hypothetical protein